MFRYWAEAVVPGPRFTLCTDGRLAPIGPELPAEPDRKGIVHHLLPRITIGTAASGHSRRHALTVNATITRLATSWKGVATVLLANPDQPLVVSAATDGPPWKRRLYVPAVAPSRHLAVLPRLSANAPASPSGWRSGDNGRPAAGRGAPSQGAGHRARSHR
ncbi:hypothetical protein [Streptomyces djakartensis]|uniref:hypothetical protein n=1 Tax=Streptomyces djakartensis TaxID=68193 RepID=UPI0034DE048C